MNASMKKQLKKYKKMYRRHLLLQNLKEALSCKDEDGVSPVVFLTLSFTLIVACVAIAVFLYAPSAAND